MAALRGRSAGFTMSDEHRRKISESQVLNRLIGHAEGRVDMTKSQVTAAIALVKKFLPDLSSVEIKGDNETPMKLVIEWQKEQPSGV